VQQPNGNDRLDRIERSIEALASTAAEFFSRVAEQNTRMAEIQVKQESRMAEIQAKHESRLNDHEEALLDHEEEHRRLLRAQVLIADELRETAAAQRETTEKLNGLIAVVDDFIRRQPKQ
jgi:glycyl-tRNA synthetase beta subunit